MKLIYVTLREKCLYSEFFWSVFFRIRHPYLLRMWEDTDQKNSEYAYFSRSLNSPFYDCLMIFVMYILNVFIAWMGRRCKQTRLIPGLLLYIELLFLL